MSGACCLSCLGWRASLSSYISVNNRYVLWPYEVRNQFDKGKRPCEFHSEKSFSFLHSREIWGNRISKTEFHLVDNLRKCMNIEIKAKSFSLFRETKQICVGENWQGSFRRDTGKIEKIPSGKEMWKYVGSVESSWRHESWGRDGGRSYGDGFPFFQLPPFQQQLFFFFFLPSLSGSDRSIPSFSPVARFDVIDVYTTGACIYIYTHTTWYSSVCVSAEKEKQRTRPNGPFYCVYKIRLF